MKLGEAEKYVRWRFSSCPKIVVNEKDREAISTILEYATHHYDDEVGFKAFCRLWLSQMLHYKTEPTDRIIQKEFVRSLAKPTSETMDSISRSLRSAALDRYTETKTIRSFHDLAYLDQLKTFYRPEELDWNLRQLYAQIKFMCNV
ncbi:hypothetical protein [Robiginitalea sp. SC105]|uniref:hypothetical protein n=1 Tax=Robiginitalea sp. SC105 TaxID=2762332 RepID=UPI00163A2D1C|nr:hypothetical protein [Robiginitalea sp. SC105]MBC2838865.1 hypothetical protein [Robiginitalea sp. SC105]